MWPGIGQTDVPPLAPSELNGCLKEALSNNRPTTIEPPKASAILWHINKKGLVLTSRPTPSLSAYRLGSAPTVT